VFGRGWEHGTATIVTRRNSKGVQAALRDTQFGASWMYDYVADIHPDSDAPVFRATFTVHFTGRDARRPDVGEQASVRFDPRSGKVEFDHSALKEDRRTAEQASRAAFDAAASGAPASGVSRSERINADRAAMVNRLKAIQEKADELSATASDPVERLERLAALRDRGVLSDAEFEAQKAKILAGP
jgi:hypothetical protein